VRSGLIRGSTGRASVGFASVRAPVTVVQGDQDRMVPMRNAEAIHRGVKGSRLVVLRGVGHVPQTESPREVVALVREAIAGVGR